MFMVDRKQERGIVDRYLGGLRLRAKSWEQPVSSLSAQPAEGAARPLAGDEGEGAAFDEPTKGVDVGAKAEIYKVIGDLAAEGSAWSSCPPTCPSARAGRSRARMRQGSVAGELAAEERGGRRAAARQRGRERRRRYGDDRGDTVMSTPNGKNLQPATAGAPVEAAAKPEPRVLTFADVSARRGGLIVLLVLFGALTLYSDQFLTGAHGEPRPPVRYSGSSRSGSWRARFAMLSPAGTDRSTASAAEQHEQDDQPARVAPETSAKVRTRGSGFAAASTGAPAVAGCRFFPFGVS